MPKTKVLLMEDNANLRYALKEYLEMEGYGVVAAEDGAEGVELFKDSCFDICIIDVMMPNKDGFTAAKEIHHENPNVPFLFLTARSMKIDKLKGFKLGADDYLVKPVDEEELIARIEAILRRSKTNSGGTKKNWEIGNYTFETVNRRLRYLSEEPIGLTEKEAALLTMLCQRKGQLLSRKEALTNIWSGKDYFNKRSMDVHIAHLRKHLEKDANVKINNVHGKGFILEELKDYSP